MLRTGIYLRAFLLASLQPVIADDSFWTQSPHYELQWTAAPLQWQGHSIPTNQVGFEQNWHASAQGRAVRYDLGGFYDAEGVLHPGSGSFVVPYGSPNNAVGGGHYPGYHFIRTPEIAADFAAVSNWLDFRRQWSYSPTNAQYDIYGTGEGRSPWAKYHYKVITRARLLDTNGNVIAGAPRRAPRQSDPVYGNVTNRTASWRPTQ